MKAMILALPLALAACVTPSDLNDNKLALSAQSAKSQAELVGCIATAWAEFQMTLSTIPTPEKTSLTLGSLYGTEARADIYTDSRVEVRLRNTLINGNGALVRAARNCV